VFNLPILQKCKIQNLQQFHDVYEQFDMYLENNGDSTSSKTGLERSPFMNLNCKFEEQELQEHLVLKEFGIKQNMHVMISFSNIPREAKKNE